MQIGRYFDKCRQAWREFDAGGYEYIILSVSELEQSLQKMYIGSKTSKSQPKA